MRREVHLIFGVGTALLTGSVFEWYYAPLLVISGFAGSFVPDLDLRIRHRALLHNVFFLVASSLLIAVISALLGADFRYTRIFLIGYISGFVSHILGDLITYRGVDLFYPFSNKSFKIPLGRSDSLLVNSIGILLGAVFIILYVYLQISR